MLPISKIILIKVDMKKSWLMHKNVSECFSYYSVCVRMYVYVCCGQCAGQYLSSNHTSYCNSFAPLISFCFLIFNFLPCCYSVLWQAELYYSTKKTMKCKYFWLYSDEFSTWNAENSGIIILNQMYQTCKDISYLFVRGSNGRSWFLRLKIGNF